MLKRILTAIPLILFVFFILFYTSSRTFTIISALIFLYGGFEWARLLKFKLKGQLIYLFLLSLSLLFINSINIHLILISTTLWWLFSVFILYHYNKIQPQITYQKYTYFWAFTGIFTLSTTWLSLTSLRFSQTGPLLVLFGLFIVWASDSGAYFAGKRFGKHLLASKISPKKTIEGLIGGLLLTLLIAAGEGFTLKLTLLPFLKFLLICLISGGACVIGDLYESLLKRIYNVKDSGQILPGHGGLLDRIDGLLATVPFFTLGMLWLSLL